MKLCATPLRAVDGAGPGGKQGSVGIVAYTAALMKKMLVAAAKDSPLLPGDIICASVPAYWPATSQALMKRSLELCGVPAGVRFQLVPEPVAAGVAALLGFKLSASVYQAIDKHPKVYFVVSDNGGGTCDAAGFELARDEQTGKFTANVLHTFGSKMRAGEAATAHIMDHAPLRSSAAGGSWTQLDAAAREGLVKGSANQ